MTSKRGGRLSGLSRCDHSPFRGPPKTLNAIPYRRRGHAAPRVQCPVCGAFCFAQCGYEERRSLVPCVFCAGHPPAVVGRIASRVVNSINLQIRRKPGTRRPRGKVCEHQPAFTDANAPRAVVSKFSVRRACASIDHAAPAGVEATSLARPVVSVNERSLLDLFVAKATARPRISQEFVFTYAPCRSALTNTLKDIEVVGAPLSFSDLAVWPRYDFPAAKLRAYVKAFHSRDSNGLIVGDNGQRDSR